MIGKTISHYRIVEKIGEGGMGVVYVAEDTLLGRHVAIKTLTIKPGQSPHFRTRFLREARAVSALSHPNIATIHDYGEINGEPYIVMEFVRGQMLGDLMLAESLTITQTLDVIAQVADALAEAHRNGVVHRDIKPSNVAINQRGEVKVLDFGLAKQLNVESLSATDPERQTLLTSQTQEGVIVGTPLYLSPEQALGADVDARSDIFSLGTLLYECVAGKPPFDGTGKMDICTKVIRDDPVPPSKINAHVPEEINRIVLKALAKKPDNRYQTAEAMADDLRAARSQLDASALDHAVPRLTHTGARTTGTLATLSDIFRRPRVSLGYVIAGAVLVVLLGLIVWQTTRAKPYQPKAEAKRLYDLAVDAMREGAFFKSSKILQQAVAADDRFALAHARLAEAWSELDSIDQAKDELIRANDLVPNRGVLAEDDSLRLQAITSTIKRDFPTAIEAYQHLAASAAVVEKPYALVDLGRAYEKNSQWDKAIEAYQQATALNPECAPAFLRLGVALQRNQKYTDAATAFDEANRLFRLSNEIEGIVETLFQRGILFTRQGRITEAEETLQQALKRAEVLEKSEQRIRTLQQLSNTSATAGDIEKSHHYSQQAMQLAQAEHMENLTTTGLLEIGNSYVVKGDYAEAEKNFAEALRLAQLYKGKVNEARAFLSLANARLAQDDPDAARGYAERALAFYQQGGYGNQLLFAHFFLGQSQVETGDYDAAESEFQQLLQLASKVGDTRFVGYAHEELGLVFLDTDRLPEALAHLSEDYKIAKGMGAKILLANAANYSALSLWRLGRYDDATRSLAEAMTIAAPTGQSINKDVLGEIIWTSAALSLSQRKVADATDKAEQALTLAGSEYKTTTVRAGSTLGVAQALSGQIAGGRKKCEEAVRLARTLRNPLPLSQALLALAEVSLLAGDIQATMNAASEARQRFTAAKQHEYEWRAYALEAQAAQRMNDQTKARQFASQAAAVLATLEQVFGAENYRSYLNRPDVKELHSKIL